MTEFLVPGFISATLGLVVFFLGAFLTRQVAFLQNYNIPEPVSGGIAVACLTWAWFYATGIEIVFEMDVRDYLLVLFFATIGLNAKIADLFKGGKLLIILLGLTVTFVILQNTVGLAGTLLFGLPSEVSVLLGSAALIGGHGTAIAWGPQVEAASGFTAAAEVGIATATIGLVLASLIGGPIAKHLIDRNHLSGEPEADPVVGLSYEDANQQSVNHVSLMRSLLTAHIAILLGWFLHQVISETGLMLPLFVPCLLVGILLSNTLPYILPSLEWPSGTRALAVLSDFSLSIFLAMSLMSMQLWTLGSLGGPLIGVLAMQVAMTVAFIFFIVFRVAGKGYLAAVLSAGFAGFSLGATPTAIANMSAVTKRYGAAPLAFIVLPLVSAFFVDLVNAVVIQIFVSL